MPWEAASEESAVRASEASFLLTIAQSLCSGLRAGPRQTGKTLEESRKMQKGRLAVLNQHLEDSHEKEQTDGIWLQTAKARAQGRNARFLFHIFFILVK